MLQNVSVLALIARLLLSSHFLLAGLNKLMDAQVRGGMVEMINSQLFAGDILIWVVAIFEVVAAIMLIVGFKVRWAALLIALFTIITSFLYHQFWAVPAEQQFVQSMFFWKNISISGGAFALAYFGAGAIAIDKD